MAMRKKLHLLQLALLIAAFVCASAAAPQSPAEKRAKPEAFGSSLKRLKWDRKKQAAIETEKIKPQKQNNSRSQPKPDALKLESLYVMLEVSITDPATSRFVTDLTRDDLIVIEDERPQQVASFTRGDDRSMPRSIILIIDYSGSQRAYLRESITAAKSLASQLAAADQMAIVTDDVELLSDFTSDKARLVAALDALEKRAIPNGGEKVRGRDLQFTALYAALRELIKNEDRRTIIIFQTDGTEAVTLRDQPTASDYIWNMPRRQYGLRDIYRAAERSRATIYSVIPSERLIDIPAGELYERGGHLLARGERARYESDEQYRRHSTPLTKAQIKLFTDRYALAQEAVANVAKLTGGWTAFLEKPEQAADIYARILRDIDHRYVIGYYPINTARDGQLRRVRIEVRGHSDYLIYGRSSYYAPAEL